MPKLKLNLEALDVNSFPVSDPMAMLIDITKTPSDTGVCGCPTVSTDWC